MSAEGERQRGLGRGLSALLGEAEAERPADSDAPRRGGVQEVGNGELKRHALMKYNIAQLQNGQENDVGSSGGAKAS